LFVLNIWHLASGIWHLASGICHLGVPAAISNELASGFEEILLDCSPPLAA
jgi:hypothetical protein